MLLYYVFSNHTSYISELGAKKVRNGFLFLGYHISSGIAFNSSIPDLYMKMIHQSFGCTFYFYHNAKTKIFHMQPPPKEGSDKIQSL